MCINIQQLTYIHPDKEVLFQHISFSVQQGQKTALTGNNGSGKSTLIQLIASLLPATSGEIYCSSQPYYVPQHFGQYDQLTIAEALLVNDKIKALHAILNGNTSGENFNTLADDWTVEEKTLAALSSWDLSHLHLSQPINTLSGGEKTKVFLAGINIHNPEIILLDEPTNHLDSYSRNKLYKFIQSSNATILTISHDRTLLNLLPSIYELDKNNITFYGGNFDFYKAQKELALNSLHAQLDEKEKELRLARKIAHEAAERKQKQDVRGEKQNIKKRISRMAMNTLKDKAEKSTSKLNNIHAEKQKSINESIAGLRIIIPDMNLMKITLNTSSLHTGKILITAHNINFRYSTTSLWKTPLSFQIKSGERIVIDGRNGAGKTTLLKIIMGLSEPAEGKLILADFNYVYLDQEYSIIQNHLTIFEQVQQFTNALLESEIKTILNRFLFPYETWNKTCDKLSGGEKMKLTLCCLMVNTNMPDMLILDEPTNNIDIQNIEILTSAIRNFKGTVLIISHDQHFINQAGIDYHITLPE